MEWYDDSIACLEVAQYLLFEIEKKQHEAIKDNNNIPYLKVTIKNFLENCRSPLDYAANYIFDTYCRDAYTPHEIKKIRTYYPKRNSKKLFDICIRDEFRGLKNKQVVQIFESSQSFNVVWFDDLTKLINENKHRNLTNQKIHNETHIKKGVLGNTKHFENVIFSGNKYDFGAGDKSFSGFELNKVFNNLDATFGREYIFKDLNKNVIETLRPIVTEAKKVIISLRDIV